MYALPDIVGIVDVPVDMRIPSFPSVMDARGGELATPKLQSFVQKSLMGPPMASLRQYTGLSSRA